MVSKTKSSSRRKYNQGVFKRKNKNKVSPGISFHSVESKLKRWADAERMALKYTSVALSACAKAQTARAERYMKLATSLQGTAQTIEHDLSKLKK